MAATADSLSAPKRMIPMRQLCQWRIGRERNLWEKFRDTFHVFFAQKCHPTDHIVRLKDENERAETAARILQYLAGLFECMSWLFYPQDDERLFPAAVKPLPKLPRRHEFHDLGGRRDMWNTLEAGFKEIHEEFAQLHPIHYDFKAPKCPACLLKHGFTIAMKKHLGACPHLRVVDYAFNQLVFDERFMATLFELDPLQYADSAYTPEDRSIIIDCNHIIQWLTSLSNSYIPSSDFIEQIQSADEEIPHKNLSVPAEKEENAPVASERTEQAKESSDTTTNTQENSPEISQERIAAAMRRVNDIIKKTKFGGSWPRKYACLVLLRDLWLKKPDAEVENFELRERVLEQFPAVWGKNKHGKSVHFSLDKGELDKILAPIRWRITECYYRLEPLSPEFGIEYLNALIEMIKQMPAVMRVIR